MTKQRNETLKQDCWDLSILFSSFEEWEIFLKTLSEKLSIFSKRQGSLSQSLTQFKTTLELYLELARKIEKAYTFAHLKHDEELSLNTPKSAYQKALGLYHDFNHKSAWFQPEILALNEDLLNQYLSHESLTPYRFFLEKIMREKPHTLPPEQEQLLALSGKALQTSSQAFSSINDADFKFAPAIDQKGEEHPLTHGTYSKYLRTHDRALRKSAFKNVLSKYSEYENTLCELLHGSTQKHLFNMRARNYPSCLESAIFHNQIPKEVYQSLIQATHSQIHQLHHYAKVRKNAMGVDKLHPYDMYVPLVKNLDLKFSYSDAEDAVIQSVAPLGKEYQDTLHKGFKEKRWVDKFENENKRSGAYSSGCYDSQPYILMNFQGTLSDVFTLAHEAGHSMHSQLSRTHQPYWYSDYSIFVAEVASTFNEELLMQHLLKQLTTQEEQFYLINQKIEDIRGTLFRQTMFAEFELKLHEMAEQNIPITPQALKDEFTKLNQFYFGEHVTLDPEIAVEWARIPHFYYNFYVYQYATGISAALTLCDQVGAGGKREQDAYLNFLKGGSSGYPIDLLKKAGVDMTKPDPVENTLNKFGKLVSQLEQLAEPSSV